MTATPAAMNSAMPVRGEPLDEIRRRDVEQPVGGAAGGVSHARKQEHSDEAES
jgi:hypothetical protein